MNEIKRISLKWFLILSGTIQICYFGIIHLFYPRFYLRSVGINFSGENLDKALLFINEIGVLAIGVGVATILAAVNPLKNIAIIISLYIVGLGSMIISSYHILFKGISSGEWLTVTTIGVQMLIVTLLYPWKELFHRLR